MKTPCAFLLFLSPMVPGADEANPFVKQAGPAPPAGAAGAGFVTVTEHILVPTEKLNAWLEHHPISGDASALRGELALWAGEGGAMIDHTAVSAGCAGRDFDTHSIWELIYPTEFIPREIGWPVPTSFETRNVGYSVEGAAQQNEGTSVLRACFSLCRLARPSIPTFEIVEKTRKPDDVLLPDFRSVTVERPDANNNDPFASPARISDRFLSFDPGTTHLVYRGREEGAGEENVDRLIFFRGAVDSSKLPENIAKPRHMSARLIRAEHALFTRWVGETPALDLPTAAWQAAAAWLAEGTASSLGDLTAPVQSGPGVSLGNVEEMIYPTEWEPGGSTTLMDGTKVEGFATPSAFETRHVGLSMSVSLVSSDTDLIADLGMERVVHAGDSVHHRILREGEWRSNVRFPIMAVNRWNTTLRLEPGRWHLIGSGADFKPNGRPDPKHVVLAFVRAD
ncbi:MAG: hypothetical protein KDN05_03475 [Verrucomicrobiae bacterium]|nr:hypothetical protein [Verrucomicrobiae bacterium]